jgi:endogenous inhibitor of DNA gyrase (YacG/DUF329 family)
MIVKCPTCSEAVAWSKANDYKPFCSKRCKLIDLGEWASEGHKIAGQQLDPLLVNELARDENID